MELNTHLSYLTGIGPWLKYKLTRLNINTVSDLIYHFPFRYDDFSESTNINEAQINQKVTLKGEIWSIKNIYTRYGKVLTQAIFNDGTNSINLTWFNQSWLTRQIKTGDKLQISGKLTKYKSKLSIIMPRWEKLTEGIPSEGIPFRRSYSDTVSEVHHKGLHTGRLVPVYTETEGLTSKWFRTKIDQVLPKILPLIKDPLPENIKGKMLTLSEALQKIHYPQSWEEVNKARERLGFDELFFVSLATQKTRADWQKKPLIAPLKIDSEAKVKFIKNLPFELTSAQKKVINEVLEDLKKDQPMNRLVQGEVGSGKTVVCAIIIYLVHLNGYKTLFMAPTEILAFQHFETISKLLKPFGITVGIYTASKKFTKKTKPYTLNPTPSVIIGTHALLSSKLNTLDVGLVIIDEQQRFGVEQRTLLRSKSKLPHFLTTTATPIPRTIALALYGDLDLSVIDELPRERLQIKTFVVPSKKRADAYKFIEKQIKSGGQAYIITPLIELSETLKSAKAATYEFERLQEQVFPKLKLGLLHGRMKVKEKDEIMQKFKEGEIDILVSTSVVEVGVDVANATIALIESAERFGLAQLHQLRGRVGRGYKQSYCLLFPSYDEPKAVRRLKNLEKIQDGLKLAELDLKIRGGGEIFGIKQSGRFEFKIASFSDIDLIEKTKKTAGDLLKIDPSLDKHPLLQAQLQSLAPNVMPD